MNKQEKEALKRVHEPEQHGHPLLLEKRRFNKHFKQLETDGYIYSYKFNTYSVRLTTKGMEKCIELIKQNEF